MMGSSYCLKQKTLNHLIQIKIRWEFYIKPGTWKMNEGWLDIVTLTEYSDTSRGEFL